MTDKLTRYDECVECGLPRFFHTDHKSDMKSPAELCRGCTEFVPHPDGWVIVTRHALINTVLADDVTTIDLYAHDLVVVEPEDSSESGQGDLP